MSSGILSHNIRKDLYIFFINFRRYDFIHNLSKFNIIKWSSDASKQKSFREQLMQIFWKNKVPESSIKMIYLNMINHKTRHTTNKQEYREYLKEIVKQPFIVGYLIRTYYLDFVNFGFDLPKI